MSIVSLKQLKDSKIIRETDSTRKLTIHGETKNHKVYKIPTNYLYYNNKNGRIISSINRYESEGNKLDFTDRENYNSILREYIIESNEQAIKKTKENIKATGQRLPGVVLEDGRIIDGNRRFTCICLINEEDGVNEYFEAVILDTADGLSDTDIKRLELNLQHAEERPVDYDPVDNLVEIYSVIVKDELFTVQEYATNTNKKKSEVEKMVKKANLMVEFLDFINAPGKYYVARDLNLDGPLQEIMMILNKEDSSDPAEFLRVKHTLFAALAIPHRGDVSRYIRDIGKNIIKTKNREEFLEEYEEIVEEVYETFQEKDKVDKNVIREINQNSTFKTDSKQLIEKKIADTVITNIKSQPVDVLKKSLNLVDGIDIDTVPRIDEKNKKELKRLADLLKSKLDEIQQAL